MEKDKKIGLLTFHTPDNYGAVYQAFALQTYVSEVLKKEIEIIDFCTDKHISDYKIFSRTSKNPIKHTVLQVLTLLKYWKFKRKKEKFKEFRNKYLRISTNRYSTEEEFLEHSIRYQTYLLGSDQVFNPYNKYYKAYYLAFPKKDSKKIAYAPSFGIADFNDEIAQKITSYIHDFDVLSCREQQGAEFLSKLVGKEVKTVVDPVYLIDKEVWESIEKKPKEKDKFIFVYDLSGCEKLIEIATKIASDVKYRIICATSNIRKIYKNCEMRYDIGPSELLGYINKAEYVVTDSFHGTSLSLVYRKKLITYIAIPKLSSRITSLMTNLGIANQIVTDIVNFNIKRIDFINYSDKLSSLITESKDFLNKSLS